MNTMSAPMRPLAPISSAACIGGGVIGSGWIARFLLAGVDVRVFDPHPEAERIVGEVIANAERAYGLLTKAPLPARGRLTFSPSLKDAASGAEWVQESVPERLDLKRSVLAEIDGGAATTRATIDRARAVLDAIGMKGVVIAREIEAFVGDRLLEALWREALWLIKDDICDVETLDNVIRYSFGLRWAQMGVFQTYRIAGGEAGMRHFLAQFGPCLKWPWTKLTDVVGLDEALIDKIAAQSDQQAAGLSIRELERIRDENLVGILQSLKAGHDGHGWGAGKLLTEFERRLIANSPLRAAPL